ncbi:MAG: hypothetical protein ACRDG3_08300 [Tepidiformaceae bacterium]
MKKLLVIAAVCLCCALAPAAAPTSAFSPYPRRAIVAMVSHDIDPPAPARVPPPPGPGYCGASTLGPPSPPNTIFGHFTIGGALAPAGTLITLTFDGHPGPSAYTAAAGGYRIDYSAGGQGHTPPCINIVGSRFGFLVNGETAVPTDVNVGDPAAYLVFLYDIAIP